MEKILTRGDLYSILDKNNKQVFKLLENREKQNQDSEAWKEIQNQISHENGEAMMLLKLIQYLEGKREFDDIA